MLLTEIITEYMQIGGCKAGCFSPYPVHTEERGGKPLKQYYTGKPIGKGVFVPPSVSKSTTTKSILNMSVIR